jgi:glycosyltransferase involved in cell wall biosynthesis
VILTLSRETRNSCIDELQALKIPVEPLNLSRAGSFAHGRRRMARFAREVNADVVHTHGFRASFLAAGAGIQCPVVSTLHCDLIRDYRLAYGRVAGPLMASCEYSALKRFDAVAAVSESVARAALNAGIDARVILNGIDLSLYVAPRGPEEIRIVRNKLGWPDDALIALHTGRLIERKNPTGVISGFRSSMLAHTGVLVFAGDGPLRAACERLSEGTSNIVFLGKRTDVPDLLKAADFLVSNSSSEGFPMALLEGCASGIHVIATAIAPHENIRRMFPEQVTLFDESRPHAIAETLDKLAAAKVERVLSPTERSLELVSAGAMSKEYQAFYTELLSAPGKGVALCCS